MHPNILIPTLVIYFVILFLACRRRGAHIELLFISVVNSIVLQNSEHHVCFLTVISVDFGKPFLANFGPQRPPALSADRQAGGRGACCGEAGAARAPEPPPPPPPPSPLSPLRPGARARARPPPAPPRELGSGLRSRRVPARGRRRPGGRRGVREPDAGGFGAGQPDSARSAGKLL